MNIFTPLNDLIVRLNDAGIANLVYNLWLIVDYIVVFLFCLWNGKHYGIKKRDAILIPLLAFVLGTIFIRVLGWAATGFAVFGPNNIVKGYSFYPLIGLLLAKWFKMDFRRLMDFTAPAYPLTQFIGHLSCPIAGCCYGYPMAHGLWNPTVEDYLFPIQFIESFVAGLVTLVCVLIARKKNYEVTGRIYPIFLILFGGTRFFLEFLRDDGSVFWGISNLALWALLMVVVGTVWLIVDKKKSKEPEKA